MYSSGTIMPLEALSGLRRQRTFTGLTEQHYCLTSRLIISHKVTLDNAILLADRTVRIMIDRWHDNVVCLSVPLSVTL